MKAIAVTYRGAKVPGSKTAKRMEKLIKEGKVIKEDINKEAEIWDRVHKKKEGAKRSIMGYLSPEDAWSTDSALHAISNPKHPMYQTQDMVSRARDAINIGPFSEEAKVIERVAKMT